VEDVGGSPGRTMSGVSEAIATYTEAEFLAVEQRSAVRHEFVGGRLYQMAGGTERHELAVAALVRRLYPGARAAGCRTFAHRQLRVPAGDHYYPDVMVACGKAANQLFEERPTLIVEVLSPTTATEDRKGKLRAYASCDSLQRYILVDPVFRRFESFAAGHWESFGPGDVIETGYGPVALDEFYDDLEAEATT
jgi:Uma2 family endonuclease